MSKQTDLLNLTDAITVDSSNNVGIGTSSPSYNLDVSAANAVGMIRTPDTTSPTLGLFVNSGSNGVGTISVDNGGHMTFDTGSNGAGQAERMRINSSGNLLLGTTASTRVGVVKIFGTSANSYTSLACESSTASGVRQIRFYNPNAEIGNISTSGTSTSYNTSSDYRLKENVVAITGATDRLKQPNPSRFNFIADADTTVDGFLAHEVQSVVPEAITCLLYTSPSPRDGLLSRMPSSA